MGHRKKNAPRRGSLAYLPRGRSFSQKGRIRYWPHTEGAPTLLGFGGYKAGSINVFCIEDHAGSPYFGKEIFTPATVLDVPPMIACAIKIYRATDGGLKGLTDIWMKGPPKDLAMISSTPKEPKLEERLQKLEKAIDSITEIRMVLCSQPRLTAISRNSPELIEVKIGGGNTREQLEYAKRILGKEVRFSEIFGANQYVDVVGVTKGKGWQGVVKRYGVKILSRKNRKNRRDIATIGPWTPAHVMYTTPRSGQMGYFQRIEYNKRILKTGSSGSEVTPKGGFTHYGLVKGNYVMLKGSVQGPAKRLIKVRYPARTPRTIPPGMPKITQINLESIQGK